MNTHHYPWWGYIKAIVRSYPGRQGRELSGVAQREQEAVQAAIDATEGMMNGRSRLEVIRLLHWDGVCTLDGAALEIPCSRSLAAKWQRQFFEEVAKRRDLLD